MPSIRAGLGFEDRNLQSEGRATGDLRDFFEHPGFQIFREKLTKQIYALNNGLVFSAPPQDQAGIEWSVETRAKIQMLLWMRDRVWKDLTFDLPQEQIAPEENSYEPFASGEDNPAFAD